MGYAFSTDDGATFGVPVRLDSPGDRLGSDPVLAVDAAGNLYLTWVAYRIDMQGNTISMRIYVSRAEAGTTTFGPPVQVSQQMDNQAQYDKPWITVTNGGTILVTYNRVGPPSEFGVVAARSNDGGATWDRSFVANDPSGSIFRNLAFPCAPKTGNHVWVAYNGWDGANVDVRLARSDDGGVTWGPELIVSQPNEPVSFDDPTCAAEGEEVWISYGLTQDSLDDSVSVTQKLYSIQLAYSSNGGGSIAQRAEIADLAAGKYFMHPYLVREDNGALDVTYYAGVADEDENGSYRRARAALPMGFSPSSIVETPLTYLQARSDARWLGDYNGLYWRAGQLYTSYVVNTSGASHVAFARYAEP